MLTTIVVELVARAPGPPARSFELVGARNRRRYGGYIVHASIVLLAIGVVGSSAYSRRSNEQKLETGAVA